MDLTPVKRLSGTGEVAEFIDDYQFADGESQNKCGPEIIAMVWHSVAPGQDNPYKSQDIHRMAHDDYVNIVEQLNNPAGQGIDDPTFYRIIESHGIRYRKLPRDWTVIREWLKYGYPVIIGGVQESTIYDAGLGGASPYEWKAKLDLTKLWHIIMATGLGSRPDRLKFRDTANQNSGPREYFHERMNYTLATLMVPKWLPFPEGDRPPSPEPSVAQRQQAEQSWAANTVGAPAKTGIYEEWRSFYMNGLNFGPPVTKEYETVDWSNNRRILQWFAGGVHYEYDPASNRGNFYDIHSQAIRRP